MDGFLCVDKPAGITSRDAVNRVQRLIRPTKIGHAGTLDPMATGVLVMALGRATKLITYVQQMAKRYVGQFELGHASNTEDTTGYVITCLVDQPPESADIRKTLETFRGTVMQLPPRFSALKVKGKRAYDLARAGKPVALQPRPVEIYSIELLEYNYPTLRLDVHCGSGTYIRSVGRDIGLELECGATMSALRRTAIGKFQIEGSVPLDELDSRERVEQCLLPMLHGVELAQIAIEEKDLPAVSHGKAIAIGRDEGELAAVDTQGKLLAVLKRIARNRFRPAINFIAQ